MRYRSAVSAPQKPADACAKCEEVCTRREPTKSKRQRELLLAHPVSPIDDLAMDDSGRGAPAPECKVCVADENVRHPGKTGRCVLGAQ